MSRIDISTEARPPILELITGAFQSILSISKPKGKSPCGKIGRNTCCHIIACFSRIAYIGTNYKGSQYNPTEPS